MNILYLSKLSGNPCAGPSYSVPEQIFAQSFVDNVFWLNLNHQRRKEWEKKDDFFHNLDDFDPELRFLPSPFNKPDLVVVEGFYAHFFSPIIKELINKKVPYIIIPRGEMNDYAQNSKWLKKTFGNLIWFNKMVDKCAGVVYLSENEQRNSLKWKHKKSTIIPNGVSLAEQNKYVPPQKGINAIFIGRLDVYHKGIDLLFDGMRLIANELRTSGFNLKLYGPEWNNSYDWINKYILENKIDDIVSLNGPVYGNEKIKVLTEGDLFVLTSRFEGLPMGLLEAMAYGLPSLVTPGTNMFDEIFQNNAGWCSNGDAESISRTLLTMTKEKNLFQKKSLNSFCLGAKYSWDSIAKKAHREYEKIIGENK